MSFRPYPDYRDSGIEWLGEVPSHWERARLRFLAELNPSKAETSHLPDSTEVSFLPMEAIGEDGSLDLSRTRPIAEVRNGYSYFADNDIVFAKVTPCFENGKGALLARLAGGRGFGTTELTVLRPRQPSDGRLLRWVTASSFFRNPAAAEMLGAGGLKRVPDDFVADFYVPWPPYSERFQICSFLDRETAKIDGLVEAQRRLIELLKEKRQAVISHAVTKGLDPSAAMKDSGIAWLGEIPAHWTVMPLKSCASFVSGGTPNKDRIEFWEGEIPWASAKDLKKEVLQDTLDHISDAAVAAGAAPTICAGAVLVLVRGMMLAHTLPVCIIARPMTINQDLKALIVKEAVDNEYFAWALRGTSAETLNRVDEAGHGTKVLRMDAWLSMKLAMPPLAEQQHIAAEVHSRVAELDSLASTAARGIELLKERRAALISAAVTGKIDVRDAAAAHPAEMAAD